MLHVPAVFLVDPDKRFIDSFRRLLEPHQFSICVFESPQQFLSCAEPTKLGCIISELQFNGANGIDFCHQLQESGWTLPILIHTAFGDISRCSRAFRAGVSDFLEKTIPPDLLVRRVLEILEKCGKEHDRWQRKQGIAERLLMLTDRENEVARALVSGLSMKEIAAEFGTSFQSVARHRQRILLKLQVDNDVALANLLRENGFPVVNIDPVFDNRMAVVHD